MIDWSAIKTEYITDPTVSYRKLAQKYGVSYQAICHRSKDEGWIALREQHANRTVTKAVNRIGNKKVDRMARIDALADRLLEKLEQAITELDLQLLKHTDKTKVIEYNNERRPDKPTKETIHEEEKLVEVRSIVDRQGLKQLAAALKDLKDAQCVRSELDEKEQKARIANLEQQANKGAETKDVRVEFEGDLNEFSG